MSIYKKKIYLKRGGWNEVIYKKLKKLIIKYRINKKNKERSYAIFDWDNTSIVNDIEEVLFIYMLENIEFKMKPQIFSLLIKRNIPKDYKKSENLEAVGRDIIMNYEYIYNNYEKLAGKYPLEEIKKSLEYKSFIIKMKYLYDVIVENYEYKKSYLWISTFFMGLSEREIKEIVKKSNILALKNNIYNIKIKSPESLSGESGVVTAKFIKGIKFIKEQQNLYRTLMNNGIDVYVCSASNRMILEEITVNRKYGYGIDKNNLYGMELKKDKNNKILPILDEDNFFSTYGKGKFDTIKKISRSYNNRDPIIVMGDSCGDYEMLTGFEKLEMGIIIESEKSNLLKEKIKINNRNIENIYIQLKDKKTGKFKQTLQTL